MNYLEIYSIVITIISIGLYLDNKNNIWWKNYYKESYEADEKLINEYINKNIEN